jgi:hypothetical protein
MEDTLLPDVLQDTVKSKSIMEPLPQPSDYQIKQFQDVRCLLANLYHFAIGHRKHLKTKKGYQAATQEAFDPVELNKLQFGLTVLMLKFIEQRWVDVNLVGAPKIPDAYLIQLQTHTMFEGLPVEEYTKNIELMAKEKRVLRELALRIS